MQTDPIADMLTRIRNAQAVRKSTVSMPSSKQKCAIARVLQDEGYIVDFASAKNTAGHQELTITLKYDTHHQPAIVNIRRMSTPGKRYYASSDDIPRAQGGLGVVIVSTNKGIMTDKDARVHRIGGEILCAVE